MYLKVVEGKDRMLGMKSKYKQKEKLVHKVTVVILVLIHLVLVLIIIQKIIEKDDYKKHTDYIMIFSAYVFTVIGLMFGVIGLLTNLKLKKYFPVFY